MERFIHRKHDTFLREYFTVTLDVLSWLRFKAGWNSAPLIWTIAKVFLQSDLSLLINKLSINRISILIFLRGTVTVDNSVVHYTASWHFSHFNNFRKRGLPWQIENKHARRIFAAHNLLFTQQISSCSMGEYLHIMSGPVFDSLHNQPLTN